MSAGSRSGQALNWELFDRAVKAANGAAIEELTAGSRAEARWRGSDSTEELKRFAPTLDKPFADRLLLWQKTKGDLVAEMETALQMPGWGNIFTQPIIARIEMLSTGVRPPVGVKVFGADLDEIQQLSQEVATVLRSVRGAANVFPTRSSARDMSRSRSTARRQPATASRSATSRTWSRWPWEASR